MDDLIRRQDAIEAINRLDIPEDMCVFEILSHITLTIGTMQSAQQWIPCSERLPEIDVFALVTLQHFNGEIDVVIAKVVKGYFSKELEWESDDGEWTWGIKHGVAWMPLPKAWKGSEEA